MRVSTREYCEITGYEPGITYYDEASNEWYCFLPW